ncbi:hypothetical protein KP509_05G055400 [Ceratopteris richardii]|uniref:non-specific serine/threonine protein kinase n=3 Tax=Ceratopteris richardii TaxID=49495 RepID=A0A8T2UQQ2_CERRI|nr:hypothetical protein KP509_05G055400 [Ceratopteris richardii]KAH7437080.1 hypothetical protein KP509_05G055400 [Ceratopteris richardii]KAH7437082.1 hypothetical protein KP509_05G055400 [Ceratopteris richardii]
MFFTCLLPASMDGKEFHHVLEGLFILLILSLATNTCNGLTDEGEVIALKAIHRGIGDVFNRLRNWAGDDPCGLGWTGVFCTSIDGTDHVTELRLFNMNLTGTIDPAVGNLTQLHTLDFMWNSITGPIPPEIGNLNKLFLLLLTGNKLTGQLPLEIGNLSGINRIQIDENNISGPIPSTFQFLKNIQHVRMNNNSLNGSIPPELGSLGKVVHILLDNNKLTGELPAELSNISTLLVLQLDNNHFSGSIPSSYSQFTQLRKLSLRNCNLTGAIPDLSAMSVLRYVDLSSNRLSGQLPSDISQNMIAIELSYNQLDGGIPDALYRLRDLQLLSLRNNLLDGSFNASILEHNEFVDSSSVLILDVQENNITAFESGALLSLPNVTLSLFGNPVCNDTSVGQRHCTEYSGSILNISVPSAATSTGARCSSELTCNPTQNSELVYGLYLRNGQCHCAYPLHIGYRLKSPAFAIFPPYRDGFQEYLSGWLNFSGYQVNVSSFYWEPGPRLVMDLKVFPSSNTTQFTDAEVNNLYTTFTTWYVPDNITFGPYDTLFFNRGFPYNGTQSVETSKGLGGGASAGIIIGAVTFTAIVMVLFMILMTKRQRRYGKVRKRRERIKVAGAKSFTYEDMSKATNNFDSSTEVGEGGYGKVFKGTLTDGMIVAIKRAQEGSLQGTIEFYNEIELLSRIHHRNLVSLIGFCDDEDEQMLVYEFMENGSLNDHLMSASSKQALDFMTRIQIALGSSRGILYLHTEANPPIYHRDIKANNILLDSKMRPKVADFGLSKLAPVVELEGDRAVGVSTVVKGTPGYLDPEYFLTSKLTDKSDVYSFGVVLLQFITGKQAITNGKNLVREVNFAYEAGMLLSVIDPRMGPYPVDCIEPFIRLAKSCCDDDSDSRPSMAEVVRELEAIWGLIPGKESMVSGEKSTKDPRMKHSMSDFYNNPVSSDISGIGLMSGTIPTISPR